MRFERRQNLRRDTAADVDTGSRHRAQRDVARLAPNPDEDVERLHTLLARAIKRRLTDPGGQVGRVANLSDASAQLFRRDAARREGRTGSERIMGELIDVHQTWARQDRLDADSSINASQFAQQLDLARRSRGEIGVAALGRTGFEAAVDIEEQRFAEPGPRSDHGRVPVRMGHTALQHPQFARLQHGYAECQCFEIVQDVVRNAALLLHARRNLGVDEVQRPLREPRDTVGHRSGDAEARRSTCRS